MRKPQQSTVRGSSVARATSGPEEAQSRTLLHQSMVGTSLAKLTALPACADGGRQPVSARDLLAALPVELLGAAQQAALGDGFQPALGGEEDDGGDAGDDGEDDEEDEEEEEDDDGDEDGDEEEVLHADSLHSSDAWSSATSVGRRPVVYTSLGFACSSSLRMFHDAADMCWTPELTR